MSFGKHVQWLGILLIPLLTIPLATCQPAPDSESTADTVEGPAPEVVISIERGDRQIRVAGKEYGPGLHKPRRVDWTPGPDNRRGLRVGPAQGPGQKVSMSKDGLKEIHIDASTSDPAIILVYGVYDDIATTDQASIIPLNAAVPRSWECIWCQGEVLVCGVNPQCDGGAGGAIQ